MIVSQTDATDPARVGGKAAALARLAREGFAPPAFFVIEPAAFGDGGTPDPALADRVDAALTALGPGPYAVRSSGQAEDGATHSHAGQFDSLLNVARGGVLDAAARVWASGFGETVATYRALKTGDAATPPAIVVQRMIAARVSGVIFTADPVSGRRDRMALSAIRGLGDRLVSGEADGQTWRIGTDGPIETPADPVLTPDQIDRITDTARRIETAFGAPQDIEWAMDDAGLHILQSRPITTPLRPPANPDDAVTVFDNSNVVESYPGVVSPLTYSFALHVYGRVYRAFVALLGVKRASIDANAPVFDNMLGRVDGRVYYNLLNWYRALALLPGFALNRGWMDTMMGLDDPLPPDLTAGIGPPPARGMARVREVARMVPVAIGLVGAAIRLNRTRADFERRLNDALESPLDLATAGTTALAAEYRRIETTLLDRWDAPLVNDFLCMMAFGASRNLLERWLGAEGLALHNDVMIGQGDIVSAEPAARIAAMGARVAEAGLTDAVRNDRARALDGAPGIRADYDAYLARFGDRCTEELKLESLPLTADPAPLVAAIAAHAERPAKARPAAPRPDWKGLFPRNPLRRAMARRLTGYAANRVRDRENLRFQRTRIFGHARRVFLALGREFHARGLLDDPRDVLFLTVPEVLGAVEGFGLIADPAAVARARKAEDAAARARPDPPERITLHGPAILTGRARAATAPATGAADTMRTGTGCCAGTVTGRAQVIRDPRTESLTPGDILIARHTDPGWIAVFSNASAIVVERGSLLSHSAIVARELGIPCVVALKGATGWIETGDTITVDGTTGKVMRQ
ncbi:PEP/pyruvate-binding domain-containing protein [Oceaniglobus indicus]|uniref:PEP/pyruvate-binding domain-containing protein n=1 Tax=Oceaniglobus indicus TaxID=2047749 RepID=UPI000C1A031D|nr:PEP/pyruvate-binding domain-containing protein [Oceaniglobus indicus]